MTEKLNPAFDELNERFLLDFPAEAADHIRNFDVREAAELLSVQSPLTLLRVWRYLPVQFADRLLPQLPRELLSRILAEMDPADCLAALNRLDAADREQCLALLPEAIADELAILMEYPPGTAGRVMDTRVMSFHPHETVATAMKFLREQKRPETRRLYLVDHDRHLLAAVDILDLMLADSGATLESIAKPVRTEVSPFDSREIVADRLTEFNLEVLPVIDVNRRLIGVIRHNALIRALQENAIADLQRMVGAGRDERALSSSWLAVRKRLPWMEINLMTAFLAASVVGLFENTIAKFTALAVLLPVVAGQSGNAGAQALAVTMRGLALREITIRNWLPVVFKETQVGFMNGVVIAATTAAGVYVWSRSAGLSLVISVAMVISMIAAGIAGALIPILLTRLGQDPAQSSSIILTTVTDVAGFMSFLGIATILIGLL